MKVDVEISKAPGINFMTPRVFAVGVGLFTPWGIFQPPFQPCMDRPTPLSTRSPNRPNPHQPSSILKRTLKTPSTIRKTNSTTTISSSAARTFKASSPGKSPTRDWASTSLYDPGKTPKPRPNSMIESGSKVVSPVSHKMWR
jgi:hypothetical protein